jgi:hypothetical protein
MRNYNKEALYPYTKELSSSEVLDYAKCPRDFYLKWVKPFELKQSGLDGILGTEEKQGVALLAGIAFHETYADRLFDYRKFLTERKVPKRYIEIIERAIAGFSKPNKPEFEMRCKYKGWSFRATLDDVYPDHKVIVEHKTSELLWTQEVCDTHDQFTFQQWVFWKKTKTLPKYTIVNWVDTSRSATQLVNPFRTRRTKTQLMAFEATIIDAVIKGIEAKEWVKPIF